MHLPMRMNNRRLSVLILTVTALITLIATLTMGSNGEAKANSNLVTTGYCADMVKKVVPEWAPKDKGWQIHCLRNGLDKKNGTNKNLLGITYKDSRYIFIRNDLGVGLDDDHPIKNLIIHEWTHAAVTEYKLNEGKRWTEWVNIVKDAKGHKDNYYGNAEEVLAENTARCSQHYYYNYLPMEKVRCSTIHRLFPEFTTVGNGPDFNE